MRADDAHHRAPRFFRQPDMTIWLFQIEPHVQFQDARSFLGFQGAAFGRAARAHLAARHVEHARLVAHRFQLEQRPGGGQLSIIWM